MSAYCRQQLRQKNDKQRDVAQSNDKIYGKVALLNDLTLKIMFFLNSCSYFEYFTSTIVFVFFS